MTTPAPRAAVVVVTHQTRDESLACLATLRDAGADEIVLVDSGSTDGTVDAVRAAAPEVRILAVDNLGFARAANLGVRATDAPVVVVANADVRFGHDSVRQLAGHVAACPSVAAVGPQVRFPDGRLQASARRLPDLPTAFAHAALSRIWPANPWTRRYRAADLDPAAPREVDWLSGCAVALRRTAFDAVGGFDPGYFLYVEDVDLAVRLRANGWRLRYEPGPAVVHAVGASTASRRRVWSLRTHAASLDRFYGQHLATSPCRRLLRPVVRLGLAAWVVTTLVAERLPGRGASTTGE